MLTQEQIQNLKPGDPIVINTAFAYVDKAGNIWFNAPTHNCVLNHDTISPELVSLPSEHGTLVPTPKHNPTRLFKKGDKVRVVEWGGREIARIGQIGRVVSDEYNSRVELAIDGWSSCIYYPACHLELVTPVEELELYSIDPANTNVLFKHGKKIATFEDDDEAQEVCDRLNEEWRKEQSND